MVYALFRHFVTVSATPQPQFQFMSLPYQFPAKNLERFRLNTICS